MGRRLESFPSSVLNSVEFSSIENVTILDKMVEMVKV